MNEVSRRAVLGAVATGTAASLAGCVEGSLGLGDDDSIDEDGLPVSTDATAQFRGGLRRQGVFPDATIPTDVEVEWTIPEVNTGDHTAAKASAVALPDGDIVVPGDTGEVRRVAPDGTVAWTASVDQTSRGIHGTPAIANETVYIGAYDGALYAFDLDTGERFWRAPLGDAIGSSPAYHDGTVYIAVEYNTPSGAMFGLDAATGEVEWEEDRPTDHPHSTCAIDRDAGRIVVGSNDGNCYAWSYPDLEFQWTFATDEPIKGPVATADGAAFFGSWDHHVYRVALDDGTEEWSVETGDLVMTGPAVEPSTGTVYVGGHDDLVRALDVSTGEQRWVYETGARLIGCPTVTSEHVVVGSNDGRCYALDKETGRESWRVEADGSVSSTPLVVEGAVYFTDRATDAYLDKEDESDGESGHLFKVGPAAD